MTVAENKLTSVLRHLRHVVVRRCDGGLGDAQLLERFVARRDEAAFEVLVWRHGPMVFGVCRRVLGHRHDAEDALQATFLALARQAGTISKRASLASWLYKVAYRTALRARDQSRRHAAGPLPPEGVPDQPSDDPAAAGELRETLDEELNRLPEKYRTLLVLSYLQGLTNEEIAAQLGCPIGTIFTRLARGRAMLRSRLLRRGVALGAGGLAPEFGESATAALPAAFVRATVRGAALFAAGTGAVAGVTSPGALALAEGVLKMMAMNRLKAMAAALVLMTLLGTGAGLLASRTLAGTKGDAPADAPPVAAAPADAPAVPRKESLRYGGKTFDEWHTTLATDLKPEVRTEAIKALSAFGANGYGQEAATAIVELMRQYDMIRTDQDDTKVVQAAQAGMRKIGPDAESVLIQELKKGKSNGRLFALTALQLFGEKAKSAVPAVVERLKDEDREVRDQAASILPRIDPEGASGPALGEALVKDPELGPKAAWALSQFGAKAKPALPQLVQAVRDREDGSDTRFHALNALHAIKPDARTVLPALTAALKDENFRVRHQTLEYLGQLGPDAKDAVEPLIAAWKGTTRVDERTMIANVFGSIGPAAKEALPLLIEALKDVNGDLSSAAREAVSKINK
jgi:RNA polymerase sigma factor (sigma-70 family)